MFKHRVCWILIDWLNHPRPKRSTQAVTGTWLGNESWPTMVKLTLFDPVFLTYCDILFEYGAWWNLKIHWLYYTDWIWIWLNAVFSVSYDFLCVSAVRVPDPTWITRLSHRWSTNPGFPGLPSNFLDLGHAACVTQVRLDISNRSWRCSFQNHHFLIFLVVQDPGACFSRFQLPVHATWGTWNRFKPVQTTVLKDAKIAKWLADYRNHILKFDSIWPASGLVLRPRLHKY